ncbi:hypothetical protein [Consotaella aegiceratis]|uniref:hypothetical protein n=1 Tax=Consotaella aegiceratis TaxID=3097961 RepID=UPI002F3F931A
MTIAEDSYAKPAFGVGSRLSETFSIFGSRFGVFAAISIVMGIVAQLVTYGLAQVLGTGTVDAQQLEGGIEAEAALLSSINWMTVIVLLLVPLLIYAVMTGMLVLAAYDAKTGRPAHIGIYVGEGLRRVVPLVVVSLLSYLAIGIGFGLLVVPGIWLIGVLSVVVPSIMVDRSGFGAFRRSSALTKGYRWPIVGLVFVIYVMIWAISAALGLVLVYVPPMPVVASIIQGAIGGLTTAFGSIAIAVTYARLREIKEGIGFTDLAAVFA